MTDPAFELLGVVTRGQMPLSDGPQRWLFLAAADPALGEVAARVERAAGGPVDEARRLPGDRTERLLLDGQARQAVHQPNRVRVAGRLEQRVHVGQLDDLAGVHD